MNRLLQYFIVILTCTVYIVSAVLQVAEPEPETGHQEKAGGSNVTVNRKGGAVRLCRKNRCFFMKIRKIVSMTESGEEVTKLDLHNQGFVVDTSREVTENGVASKKFRIRASKGSMDLTIIFYIFRNNGTFQSLDGNDYDVTKGSLKMNVEVNNWTFDESVKVGKFMDIHFQAKCDNGTLKARKANRQTGRRIKQLKHSKKLPITHKICDKSRLTFSSAFRLDNTWKDMPEGYPKPLNVENGWAGEIVRFERGHLIFYDPIAEVGDDIDDTIPPVSGAREKNASLLGIVTILTTMFFTKLYVC